MTDLGVTSMGKFQQTGNFVTHEKRHKDAIEFKRTHFVLGNHPKQQLSEQKSMYRNHSQSHGNLKPSISTFGLQQSHFNVGDPKKESAFFFTNYHKETDKRVLDSYKPQDKIDNKNFSTNIKQGHYRQITKVSQNQRTYKPINQKDVSKMDKDFIANIRGSHFTYGDMNTYNPGSVYTVAQASFNYKGDAQSLKATIDAKRKADLRKSHFDVGKESAKFTTNNLQAYRPQTSGHKPDLNLDRKRDLQSSHFEFGERPTTTTRQGVTPFVTQNMTQYRWVQPVPKLY